MLQIPKWLHSSEDSEVDNHLEEKVEFADLVKDAGSVAIAGSAPSRQFRAGRNDVTNTVWLPRQFQNDGLLRIRSFKTNFFRIARTSEAETSVCEKAECLLAIGEDKKVSFLKWLSTLTNNLNRNKATRQIHFTKCYT